MTADQALAAINEHHKHGGSLKKAKELLSDLLAKGSITATEGEEAGRANGIS